MRRNGFLIEEMNETAGFKPNRGRGAQPEILAPGQQPVSGGYAEGYAPNYGTGYGYDAGEPAPAPQANRPKRLGWASAPATYTLVGINILVYLWMCLRGFSPFAPTSMDLIHSGANVGVLVLGYGQWWRLITAMFVHVGIIHIGVNMWCLWNLGLLAEPLMGPVGVIAAYLLTGFAGNILSVARHPGVMGGPQSVISAGASGAIFGLAGVLIILLRSPLLPIPPLELKKLRRSVIWFAVLNLVLDVGVDAVHFIVQVDNMAHIGGLLSGVVLGLPMVPRIGSRPEVFRKRRNLAILLVAFLLLLLTVGVYWYWLGRGSVPGMH